MNVTFNAPDPRHKARPLLDKLLECGTDQIAIVCPFLTGGGALMLKQHVQKLRLRQSFLVVAWEEPTISFVGALKDLHSLCPGNVYLHLGAETPEEKRVGAGLMHSKVFFARAGDRCWLWTGSHNLTANAIQGVNCEAAIVLDGCVEEQPFQDAVAHLEKCRQEAIVFDPYDLPRTPRPDQTLIIHAECHASVKPCPWFVHLRVPTTVYDSAIRPPAAVWVYLYSPGTLRRGRVRPAPEAAYSGALTALNFTEHHPQRGIPADWQEADYVIDQDGGVFHLLLPRAEHRQILTQGVFRVQAEEDPSVMWLTENPTPKLERIVGDTWRSEVDPDFRGFFTARSLQGETLIHRAYRDMRPVYRVSRRDAGFADAETLQVRLPPSRDARVEIREDEPVDDRFAFIYRAKYRV